VNQVQATASTDPDSDPDSADDDISLLRPRTEDAFEPSVRLTTIAATPTLFARGTPINSTTRTHRGTPHSVSLAVLFLAVQFGGINISISSTVLKG
jgi:hypothetical protein